ncbi:uncharacterized protein METZ01_LOCUS221913 [marine metagenome]|uniref:Uncharacterized protein n=1 Tax=marine metagenome TaxID=408172 RepID=A0A382G2F1_9ZZZZ
MSSLVIVLFPEPGGPVIPMRMALDAFSCRSAKNHSVMGSSFSMRVIALEIFSVSFERIPEMSD